jgi:hypothetical protein
MSESDDSTDASCNEQNAVGIEPDPDELDNGAVRLVLDVYDPVTSLGIVTERESVEVAGSQVSADLADHLWAEHGIDVEEHDIKVVE